LRLRSSVAAALVCIGAGLAVSPRAHAATCESLASLAIPNVRITLARTVPAGGFTPPGGARQTFPPPPRPHVSLASAGLGLGYNGGRANARFEELPAFCRVTATVAPSPTSDIRVEVWLPAEGWNGSFRGTGPNGLGGTIPYNSMANALRDGYVTASDDTGHRTAETNWMDDPERLKDFGYRAIHEATVLGKSLLSDFYGKGPSYSYMTECGGASTAALSSVQTYPGDYDGVVVGGFAAYWTRQVFGQMWPWEATHESPASYIPPEKLPAIYNAVLKACDALDGVRDGVLEDPTRCRFDPKELACKGADSPTCLTPPQVEAVRKIYQGPVNPRTKERIHSPVYRGSELDWEILTGPQPLGGTGPLTGFFRSFIFKDPAWDYKVRPVNFDSDVTLADRPDIATVNAVNPDLTKFVARGGRLILANGWSNAIVPPGATIDYYNNVRRTIGAKAVEQGVRLYMVPGMSECNGGPGTDTFDMFAPMRQWVERGKIPHEVVASRVEDERVVRTRPLCPYPQVAVYRGAGNTDDAANFVCK